MVVAAQEGDGAAGGRPRQTPRRVPDWPPPPPRTHASPPLKATISAAALTRLRCIQVQAGLIWRKQQIAASWIAWANWGTLPSRSPRVRSVALIVTPHRRRNPSGRPGQYDAPHAVVNWPFAMCKAIGHLATAPLGVDCDRKCKGKGLCGLRRQPSGPPAPHS